MERRYHLGHDLFRVDRIDKLSPIPEYSESGASPHPKIAADSLPELVIEPQSRRYEHEDETEEFYNRLEIKMKNLYKKLFLQTDGVAEECLNDNVTNCSIDDAVGETDDDEEEVVTLDDEDDSNMSRNLMRNSEGFEEDSDANRITETSSSTNAGMGLSDNREESDVATIASGSSSVGHDTSASRVATESEHSEPTQEQFAEIRGNITEDSSSAASNMMAQEDAHVKASQTFTEKYGQSESSSKTSNDTNEVVSKRITVQALIHSAEKNFENHDIEVMRRQKTMLLENSLEFLHSRRGTSNSEPDLNAGRYSLEGVNTTINTPMSMELESFNLSQRSSFLRETSPILTLKRPLFAMPCLPAKRTKSNDHDQGNENQTPRNVANEIEANRTEEEIQANVNETFFVNAENLTDFPNRRDFETEMSTSFADVGTQTDVTRNRDNGTQTEGVGTRDQGTQTSRRSEYYQLFNENNFFFMF